MVTGRPHIRIRPGVGSSANRNAEYDRHASPTQLVFSYTVASSDDVNGGFTVPSGNIIVGNNEAIENVYGAAASNTRPTIGGPKHDVDGSFTAPKGGICERSGPIGLALTAMVKANDSAVASCADVTAAHLAALTGMLTAEVGAIEPGDLAGLGSLTGLDLSGGDLVALPAGVFDRLVRLETLRLDDNDLAALPDGIFETLTALDDLRFGGNPGSSGFEPAARAASEADAATGGQTLRLDGTGSATGPWGANVTWSWERVDAQGNVATPSWLVGADTARPSVTVPHDLIADRARFRLTVTGRGVDRGSGNAAHRSRATVAVDIRSSPAVETVAVVSHPRAGGTYGLGETIEVALGYTAPVTVTGTPAIELLLGDAPGDAEREAAYARGSGGRRLVFAYTVVAGDRDTDGIRSCSAALETQNHCRAGVLLDAGESVS